MSDILELSDADFALKMQGLVHEAEKAMGRAGKSPAPEPAAAPAEPPVHTVAVPPTPAAPPPPGPTAAVPPLAEPARPAPNLTELLRPLVLGVQAVGRVSSEHTQLLARIDKSTAEGSTAQTALPQIVSDLKGLLEQRNTVSRQMFDALHEELRSYKDGFLLDSVHRPMIRDLITLYDDLCEIYSQARNVVGSAPVSADSGPAQRAFLQRLGNLETHLEHNLEFILEVLARLEVQQMPIGTGKLDKRTQKAVSVEIAEDPDQDMDVVRTLKRGFLWKDRVVRPEEVIMKKWKEGFLVALQTPAP